MVLHTKSAINYSTLLKRHYNIPTQRMCPTIKNGTYLYTLYNKVALLANGIEQL